MQRRCPKRYTEPNVSTGGICIKFKKSLHDSGPNRLRIPPAAPVCVYRKGKAPSSGQIGPCWQSPVSGHMKKIIYMGVPDPTNIETATVPPFLIFQRHPVRHSVGPGLVILTM